MNDAQQRLQFTAFWIVLFFLAAVETRNFNRLGTWFPLYTSILGIAIGIGILYREFVALGRAREAERTGAAAMSDASVRTRVADAPRRVRLVQRVRESWFAILVAYVVLSALVGTWLATAIWLPLVMHGYSRVHRNTALGATAVWLALVGALAYWLDVRIPESIFLG